MNNTESDLELARRLQENEEVEATDFILAQQLQVIKVPLLVSNMSWWWCKLNNF